MTRLFPQFHMFFGSATFLKLGATSLLQLCPLLQRDGLGKRPNTLFAVIFIILNVDVKLNSSLLI